jgi:hypothetical protein
MRLREYIDTAGHGEISRIVRAAGVAASTLHDVLNGKPIRRYETAKKIAAATGGKVTVEELCEAPAKPAKRKRAA